MGKVGLVAGKGKLPLEFVRSAKAAGDSVVVFAINGMASPQLEEETDNIYWLNVGQFGKFIFLLLKEKIRQLAFIGKVEKSTIDDEDEKDGGDPEHHHQRHDGVGHRRLDLALQFLGRGRRAEHSQTNGTGGRTGQKLTSRHSMIAVIASKISLHC